MYGIGFGLLSIFLVWRIIAKKKNGTGWMVTLSVSCMILGSAPMIQAFIRPLVNTVFGTIAETVFGQALGGSQGLYAASVIIVCAVGLAMILKDGHVNKLESWILVIFSFVVGSTALITSWLPSLLDSVADMVPVG